MCGPKDEPDGEVLPPRSAGQQIDDLLARADRPADLDQAVQDILNPPPLAPSDTPEAPASAAQLLTVAQLRAICGEASDPLNVQSFLLGLQASGSVLGLSAPHRLAQYTCQVAHESGRFVYDREVWGPTAAQKRYDTRTDLGNTPQADGDGYRYRGRSGIQLTGKYNYQRFTAWAKKQDPDAPDFVATPDLINTDPWEGLVPLWYWSEGNPTGKSLNRYADANDIEMITRRINGGLNGFEDRLGLYTRTGLVLLGYKMQAGVIKAFQKDAKARGQYAGEIDDLSGPGTRGAIHMALLALS